MKFNKKRILSVIKDTHSVAHLLSVTTRFLLVILVICLIYSGSTQKEIADNVVRLHIVANSDSTEDQALKLKVRDAILAHIKTQYPNGATREEAAHYLKSNITQIEEIAKGVLRESGTDEPVNAQYGVFSFPTKEYDDIALPAGRYEAVRVELGKAQGQNWWCIMFPPLCVADANSLRLDEQAMSQLKDGLGDINYSLITEVTERSNVPIKIRFRIVELMESSKIKLAEMISHLF